MLKTNAAAAVAIALAWAMPALAQNPPPQERIHERLEVSFKDAAGEFLGRLSSDVTTSHSAVEGYLQGPDGYVFYCEPRCSPSRTCCRSATARSAVADIAPVIPLLSCPEVELQGGGPPGSLSLLCQFDGRRREVIRRMQRSVRQRAARQRFAGGTPRQHRMRGHGQRRRASRGRHAQLDEGDTLGRVDFMPPQFPG